MVRSLLIATVVTGLSFAHAVAGGSTDKGKGDMTGAELADTLQGTWAITDVANAQIPEGAIPTLVFEPERLAGFAGCNNYGVDATYGDDGVVRFGDARLTRKACGMAAMELESQIVNALNLIDKVEFDAENQIALSAFGDVMIRAERQSDG